MLASRTFVLVGLLLFVLGSAAGAQPASDMDWDGTPDDLDICMLDPRAPVPNACDTDMDGYGNQCDGDFNDDGQMGGPDFASFGAAFGSTGPPCSIAQDLNGDGAVGGPDFAIIGASFGTPVGPSGLACAGTVPCP